MITLLSSEMETVRRTALSFVKIHGGTVRAKNAAIEMATHSLDPGRLGSNITKPMNERERRENIQHYIFWHLVELEIDEISNEISNDSIFND